MDAAPDTWDKSAATEAFECQKCPWCRFLFSLHCLQQLLEIKWRSLGQPSKPEISNLRDYNLPSWLSRFLKWIRWVFQSWRKPEDEINKIREEIARAAGGGTYVFRWYFKIDGELMRQRSCKLTPDGRNSNGKLVWRDRTQAGTRQGDVRRRQGGGGS